MIVTRDIGWRCPACKHRKHVVRNGPNLFSRINFNQERERELAYYLTIAILFVNNTLVCPTVMGKSKVKNKKDSPKQKKSVLNGVGGAISKPQMAENNTTELLEKATILLQTGQAEAALPLAQRVLELSPENSPESLSAVNLVGEIYVELGDIDAARQTFLHAVQIDPEGTIPESQGGGAEKFLWLAQLSEQGGADSVGWYEKGVGALRNIIQSLEQSTKPEDATLCEEKRKKLATALCGVVEIYMTDLS